MEHLEELPTAEQLFGAMVRRTREERGWTQEELRRRLAEREITLEKTAMIRLESGKRPIRFNEVVALSRILGLELSTMAFAEADHMPWSEYIEAEQEMNRLEMNRIDIGSQIDELDRHRERLEARRAAMASKSELLRQRLALAYRYRGAAARESVEYGQALTEEQLAEYEKRMGKEFADGLREQWKAQRDG